MAGIEIVVDLIFDRSAPDPRKLSVSRAGDGVAQSGSRILRGHRRSILRPDFPRAFGSQHFKEGWLTELSSIFAGLASAPGSRKTRHHPGGCKLEKASSVQRHFIFSRSR
jgi:hypothetical protein